MVDTFRSNHQSLPSFQQLHIRQITITIMQIQIVLVLVVATVLAAGQEQPKYSANAVKPNYEEKQAPMPYKFAYAVKDEPTKNDYSHQQESDGKVTTGSYRVVLPDGRTQIVTYRADENGYVADVKYEGEAKYPEPSQYKPAAGGAAYPKA